MMKSTKSSNTWEGCLVIALDSGFWGVNFFLTLAGFCGVLELMFNQWRIFFNHFVTANIFFFFSIINLIYINSEMPLLNSISTCISLWDLSTKNKIKQLFNIHFQQSTNARLSETNVLILRQHDRSKWEVKPSQSVTSSQSGAAIQTGEKSRKKHANLPEFHQKHLLREPPRVLGVVVNCLKQDHNINSCEAWTHAPVSNYSCLETRVD